MTSTLSLAERLGGLDDRSLHDLIDGRGLTRSRIEDFFDLADALLEPPSVQHALAPLPRPVLAALAALAEHGGAATAEQAAECLRSWGATDVSTSSVGDDLNALVDAFLAEQVAGPVNAADADGDGDGPGDPANGSEPVFALYPGVAARFTLNRSRITVGTRVFTIPENLTSLSATFCGASGSCSLGGAV